MKLRNNILLYAFFALSCLQVFAQSPYIGGASDGFAKNTYSQGTVSIFSGGAADGYSKLDLSQADQVNLFLGGINDGYSRLNFMQGGQINNFFGGIADGYARFNFTQADQANIFYGGIADGFAKFNYSQFILSDMYLGGIADGFAKSNYAQADPAVPEVSFIASDSTICVGTCINFTDLSTGNPISWSWSFPGANVTSSTQQNPTNICYNTAGNYTVTLRATNIIGVDSLVKTAYIVVSPLPTANAGTDVSICNGSSATLNASGGTSYSWLPATGLSSASISNPVASPGATTNYTVTVTNAAGCSSTDVVIVTVNPLPTVSVSPITICAGASGTLSASGASVYSWSPGLSSTTGTSVTANPTSTTTYTVTGTTVAGCQNSTTVTVTVNPGPAANAGTDVSICNGSSTTLNASGGTSYSWSPFSTLSSAAIPNPVATPTVTTNYTVTVTGGGCSATDVVTVTVNSVPNISVTPITICAGSSGTLTAAGAPNFSWAPATGLSATTGSSVTASPTTTTTYTVTGTNAAGCTKSVFVTVTVNTPPTANAGNDITICNGSSTTLSASGGGTYSWSPSSGLSSSTIANPVASPSTTTSYTVTVTSGTCSATDVVTITVNPLPIADAGTNITICNGSSTTLNASGGTSYSWSPSGSLSSSTIANPLASPASTTNYTVTVTGGGCSATDVVTVTVNTVLADAGNNITICTGSNATLNASGGTSYNWAADPSLSSTTIANPVASPTITTTYTVTVNNSGCSATDVVTVTVSGALTANAGADVSICNGFSTTLMATGGATYSWLPTTGLSSPGSANTIAAPSTTTNYTVTVSSGGCSATDVVTVTVNSVPVATITPDGPTTFCEGDSVILTSSVGVYYLWSTGATTPSITVINSNNYNVTVTNASGCSASSTVLNVVVHPVFPSSINPSGPTTFCQGGNVTLVASAGGSYTWSTGAITQSITVTTGNDYYVSVTDVNGCSTSADTITVTVNPNPAAPVISPSGIYNICVGDTVTLSAPVADNYLWSNGANAGTISVTSAGLYSVTVYNVFGCGTSSADTTEVTVNDPVSDFTATPLLVFIPSANVNYVAITNGSGPFTYLWDFGDATTSGAAAPSHTYGTIGFRTVSVTVSDSTGCSKTITKPDYIQVEQLFPSDSVNTGTTIDISGVAFVDPAVGIFTLTDGNCVITLDTANTCTPLLTGNSYSLTGGKLLPGNWFVTGDSGTILHSINNGASWTPFATGTFEKFNGCSFNTASNGFAVGTNGTIQKYNGSTWTPETSGTLEILNAVDVLSSGEAVAVGDNGTILYYNGSTWSPRTSPVSFNIRSIKFSSALVGYAVGTSGNIIKTIDGGSTWTPTFAGIDEHFNSITVEGTDSAWATGTGGVVYTTVNGGTLWERYSVGHLGTQNGINKTPGGKGHIVGTGGHGRVFGNGAGITTGVNGTEKTINTFKVYPNPAHDQITISMELFKNSNLKIILKDIHGKSLEMIERVENSGNVQFDMNIEKYSSGIYFIHVKEGEKHWVQKLVITK
jgi:PKD repeat protein